MTTLLCLALGLLLREAIDYQRRKDGARELIASLGGRITDIGWSLEPSDGENWLSRMLLETEYHERLWSVDLSGTSVSSDDLAKLSKCDWIRGVNLSNTTVGDADLSHVAKMTKLRNLNLVNTEVSDAGIISLALLERLRSLDTQGSRVTYAGLGKLDRALPDRGFAEQLAMTRIQVPGIAVHGRVTSLAGVEKLGDEFGMFLRAPAGYCSIFISDGSALRSSTFKHAQKLTSTRSMHASFGKHRFKDVEFIKSLPELRQLSIDGGQLTDEDFAHIAALPKLKYLSLVGWHHLSDAAIEQLGENNTLVRLDLNGLDTTLEITSHLGGLKRLRMLELNSWARDANGKYGSASPEQIVEARAALQRLRNLPSLEVVRLQGNVFTDEVIEVLGEMKGLKQIGYDKRFVNGDTIVALRASLPECEIKSDGFSDSIDLD